MAEQFLDRAQIGTSLQQVGRERVPKRVRVHAGKWRNARLARPDRETSPDVRGIQAVPGFR